MGGVGERIEAVEDAEHDRLEGEESKELEDERELVEVDVQEGCLGIEASVRPDKWARIAGGRTDSGCAGELEVFDEDSLEELIFLRGCVLGSSESLERLRFREFVWGCSNIRSRALNSSINASTSTFFDLDDFFETVDGLRSH